MTTKALTQIWHAADETFSEIGFKILKSLATHSNGFATHRLRTTDLGLDVTGAEDADAKHINIYLAKTHEPCSKARALKGGG